MCGIGIFIIGHFISGIFGYRRSREPLLWRKLVAVVRYLSYRGFRVESLKWNSAPVGILLLGLAGTIFFFCKSNATHVMTEPDGLVRYGLDSTALLLVK